MTRRQVTMPRNYFEGLYASSPDPWHFATSDYERHKYTKTLDAIGDVAGEAFEIGCSIGIFTRALAARCTRLLAVDIAEQALIQARSNCAGLKNVELKRMRAPQELPARRFDLVLLSETGYYWSEADLDCFIAWVSGSLVGGGRLVLVHWTGETDYPLTADEVHERVVGATAGLLKRTGGFREEMYRLDILTA